jgi:hypothetical protein
MSRSETSAPEGERAAKKRPRRLLLPLIAITGLFATIMLAAAAQGLPQFGDWAFELPAVPIDELPTQTPGETAPPLEPPDDSPLLAIIGIILIAIVAAFALTLVYFGLRVLIRYLLERWRDRPLARRDAAQIDAVAVAGAPVEVEPDEATIRRGIAAALQTIDERPVPGDSIVAAWVGLEESAADAEAGRGVNETPSEFTVRIIGRRAGIAAEVVALLALYERVRFGGHVADEDDRATASACLRGIEAGWR